MELDVSGLRLLGARCKLLVCTDLRFTTFDLPLLFEAEREECLGGWDVVWRGFAAEAHGANMAARRSKVVKA